MASEKGRVCVTGAGGFLGSWVVNQLLSKDWLVHGTIRDPRCRGVFHVASPAPAPAPAPAPSIAVPNPEVQLIEPAVKGTLNVLKANAEPKVKRVIIVSSGSAVVRNPNWPKDQVMDETCCSDEEHCRTTESTVNASAKALIKILKDGCNSLEHRLRLIVDARDVVEEQVLAYEMPEAKDDSFDCSGNIVVPI
ncbi:cinnamoyl-CoA reductase 1-like [Populus alba]|uniref:cinnamoyl-CoA reductase 1-like n=1 Tax=Populus alba TaxID=43335 RepID=UPI003CC751F9